MRLVDMKVEPKAEPVPPPPPRVMTPPRTPDRVHVGETSLWSTYSFEPSQSLANTRNGLFRCALGSQGQGFTCGTALSIAETNIKEPGRVGGGLAFIVRSIGVEFTGSSPGTRERAACAAVLSWDFTQTQIEIGPVSTFYRQGDLYTFNYMSHPIHLPANTSFGILLQFGNNVGPVSAGQDPLLVRVVLHGQFQTTIAIG